MEEETDNPADELGIPEGEYKEDLDGLGGEDIGVPDDDIRETLEDLDEDDDNAASASQ